MMRNSLLISLAIAGLVIFSVTLSVFVTAAAAAEASQDAPEAPEATGMFRVGYAYTVYSYPGHDNYACGLVVLETRESWIRVMKWKGTSDCGLRWTVLRNTPREHFRGGQGVWINSDHLLSVIEWGRTQ